MIFHLLGNEMHLKKKKLETVMWGSEPVVWGSEPLMWGSELLMWGSEVSFANNFVRRSEMWGSWPPSPPTLARYNYSLVNVSLHLVQATL